MNLPYLRLRSATVKAIRAWFDARDFLEVQTPRLVGLPGQEPFLEPFWTEVVEASGSRHPAGLITSPEYACKRLIAAGIERLYDLGSCFRNGEPWDGTHDPEFLMLEWYRREADMEDLMRDTEQMMRAVGESVRAVGFDPKLDWANQNWQRITVEESWRVHAGVELGPLLGDRDAMAQVAMAHGQTVLDSDSWDDLYFKVFLSEIEPKLGFGANGKPCPTFLYRYSASMAALARRSKDDARWADRVELYVGTLELANGFAELSDEAEQRARFEEERSLRAAIGKPTWPLDERFLQCLPAMGDAAGIAFGVDRLVMLFAGTSSITDILPFSAQERFGDQVKT